MSEQMNNNANGAPEGGFQPSPEFIQRVARVKQATALQEPDRVRKLGIFQFQFQHFAVRLLETDCLEALVTREVVGQGHRLDVPFHAMRTHELADSDVLFGFRHVECGMRHVGCGMSSLAKGRGSITFI